MFKQSFYIVAIQLVGIILGFLSIYFVAGDMGPEVYSLVGVYLVVSNIVLIFSNLGMETTMMREALYWIEHGNLEKVAEYTVQSIVSRFIGFVILAPFVIGYLLFLCQYKYDGNYLVLLLLFYIGACANALNDSMSLIIRSQGGYVFSTLARAANNDIIKFAAILLYLKFGSQFYLFFYSLSSIPLIFVFVFKIRKYLRKNYILIKPTFKKIKVARNLWINSYLGYFSNYADSLLVSLLFPPAIMGLYSLYKSLESVVRSFVDGFFDVLLQKFVQFKENYIKLMSMERKVNIARWVAISLVIVAAVVFSTSPNYFISLANLAKYNQADIVIYCVMLVAILLLLGKVENTLLNLMGPSKIVLQFGLALFVITLLSFIWVLAFRSIYGIMIQRITIFGLTSLIAVMVFRRKRTDFYTKVYN